MNDRLILFISIGLSVVGVLLILGSDNLLSEISGIVTLFINGHTIGMTYDKRPA